MIIQVLAKVESIVSPKMRENTKYTRANVSISQTKIEVHVAMFAARVSIVSGYERAFLVSRLLLLIQKKKLGLN